MGKGQELSDSACLKPLRKYVVKQLQPDLTMHGEVTECITFSSLMFKNMPIGMARASKP
jgi:hypothetical protein